MRLVNSFRYICIPYFEVAWFFVIPFRWKPLDWDHDCDDFEMRFWMLLTFHEDEKRKGSAPRSLMPHWHNSQAVEKWHDQPWELDVNGAWLKDEPPCEVSTPDPGVRTVQKSSLLLHKIWGRCHSFHVYRLSSFQGYQFIAGWPWQNLEKVPKRIFWQISFKIFLHIF